MYIGAIETWLSFSFFFLFPFGVDATQKTAMIRQGRPNPPAVQDTTGRKKGGEFWSGRNLNALNENQLLFYCWMLISKPQTTARQQQQPQKRDVYTIPPIQPRVSSFLLTSISLMDFIDYISSAVLCVSFNSFFFIECSSTTGHFDAIE